MEIQTTADGSPTARLPSTLEAMHSARGAFGETVYVYGEALAVAREPRCVISVGLGLGYCEMLVASRTQAESWKCRSFEREPALRDAIVAWVRGGKSATYDAIAARFGGDVRGQLARAYAEGRWQIDGALDANTKFIERANVVLFDAFSRAACPELWSESFLERFLAEATADACVFATYASTATLKRVLDRAGFTRIARRGYGGKRECTLARR